MPLLVDALLALVTASVFAFVGREFARREATGENRRARDAFVAWWLGIALLTLLAGARSALAAFGVLHVGLHTALTFLTLAPLAAALFGLNYYLLYVHTGNARLYVPLAVAYGGLFVAFAGLVTWLRPVGVEAQAWRVTLTFARELSGWPMAVVLVLLLGPCLLAALLYGSLIFRAQGRAARYRVAMTAGAFVLWFGSAGVASATGLAELPGWPLASRAVQLVASGMVLAAYRPPRAIRERLAREAPPAGPEAPRGPDRLQPALRPLRATA